jgi:putative oxidoreductase
LAAFPEPEGMMKEPRRDDVDSIGLLVLRLGAGGLLLCGHGWAKLMNAGARAPNFADPIGLGPVVSFWLVVFAEVLCSALVMLGLFTRLGTIPILGFLTVAAFVQHAHDPWPKRELAFVFAVPFLALLLTGPGRFSMDEAMKPRWPWGGRRGS